jgi:hypothetical protein
MIAFLTARYWAERGRAIRENERRRGWNWAAGELLAGTPMAKVENYAQQARDFDHETAFDEGVFDACKAWSEKVKA